ncbi:MAG: PilN domain-containing protein, partial [Betaproteobacteria bacterium]|nr:PilN domain-containing protein [Betaproteobacteria bacterium]
DRLAKEIEKIAGERNFVLARKHSQYPMVMLLEDLSRLLPDTTWIQQLEVKPGVKGRDVQFYGETGSSSQLIETLEKSGVMSNANFKSPLTKGVTPNSERFFLGAELKARPMPDPIPESSLVPPASQAAASAPAPAASPAAGTATPSPAPAGEGQGKAAAK